MLIRFATQVHARNDSTQPKVVWSAVSSSCWIGNRINQFSGSRGCACKYLAFFSVTTLKLLFIGVKLIIMLGDLNCRGVFFHFHCCRCQQKGLFLVSRIGQLQELLLFCLSQHSRALESTPFTNLKRGHIGYWCGISPVFSCRRSETCQKWDMPVSILSKIVSILIFCRN